MSYTKRENLKGTPLGWAPDFLQNFRLGWYVLPVRNNLAYLIFSSVKKKKSYITLTTGANAIKVFSAVIYGFL